VTTGPPPEGSTAPRDQTPQAWIGEQVEVVHFAGGFRGTADTTVRATLVEVNDRGIVLLSDGTAEMFIPWSAVAIISRNLTGEAATQEQQYPHLGARIGGPTGGPTFPGGSPNIP
jgi:hypothetical protein